MMPNFTDLTGLAGVALLAATSLLLLPGMAKIAGSRRALLMAAVLVLLLIPLGTLPLAAYVRGITGDLSITTLVLLCSAQLSPWCGCVELRDRQRLAMLGLVALASLGLYPMALGVGAYDPYQLGYGNLPFVVALLLLALAAWLRGYAVITLCIALAMLAWAVGWYESDNLWDYLIDPFVSVYALVSLVTVGFRIIRQPRSRGRRV